MHLLSSSVIETLLRRQSRKIPKLLAPSGFWELFVQYLRGFFKFTLLSVSVPPVSADLEFCATRLDMSAYYSRRDLNVPEARIFHAEYGAGLSVAR